VTTIDTATDAAPRPPAAAVGAPAPSRSLVARAALYGGARGISEGLMAVRGIVLAGLLGPTAFGGWALLRLATRYAAFANLGVLRGLEYELLPTRDETRTARSGERLRAARTTLGYLLAAFSVLALAAVALSFRVDDPLRRLELRTFAGVVLVDELYMYGLVCLRIRGDLRRYAQVELVHAVLQVACVTLLAWRWGLGGALTGLVLATATAALLTTPYAPLRPTFRRASFRRLLATGFPVVLAQLLAVASASVDRWVVAGVGGTTLLGYYSFAAALAGLGGALAWVLRTVVIRDLYGHARSAGAAPALRAHLDQVVRPYALLFPALLGAAAFGIGPSVALLVPRYLPAIEPARLFMFAGAATGLVQLATVGVVAARRQRILPWLSAGTLVLSGGAALVALRAGAGLEMVATGSLVGQFVVAGGLLHALAAEAGVGAPAGQVAKLLAPFLWCMLLVVGLGHLLPGSGLGAAALGLALYLVALLPLAPALSRQIDRVR
jgi:O-antigen/teichoic acid export membrane protein